MARLLIIDSYLKSIVRYLVRLRPYLLHANSELCYYSISALICSLCSGCGLPIAGEADLMVDESNGV